MRGRAVGRALCALSVCLAVPAAAQTAAQPEVRDPAPRATETQAETEIGAVGGIVVLDTERLFAESLFGLRLAEMLQAETEALIEENRRIEAELTAEEQALTRRRPGMDPVAFREEAEAFDAKVQQIRRERDAKERALQQEASAGRERFLAAIGPTLGEVMMARGAAVILDRRAVFLSTGAVDVTEAAIAAIDAEIGDGSDLAPEADAVETPGTDTAPER
ncbi:OmpH family outer membrane protein [Limimaricola litoreus]|uniref:OmpH family outer membrane protein n=1 Tax=Limimaricola litoreus TaxID=2955316 RepID=A0A9X2FS56_9RHOB|nr:OmpH family outer membrane protein [Limimaricola litoreus]MCP1169640.1 OmpH family outer membrane protein [Limimaricola litoreus]